MEIGSKRMRMVWAVCTVYLAALILRLIGVNWHGVNLDEQPQIGARMLAGQLTGFTFFYPPLINYLTAVGYVVLFAIGRAAGWWRSLAEFKDAYYFDRDTFMVVGRIVVALLSACTAPLAFIVARQLRISWIIAILIALAGAAIPGSVLHAHYAKGDSILAASFLLVAVTSFHLLDKPQSIARAMLVGIALALSVSFKQSAIFFDIPMMLLIGMSIYHDPIKRSSLAKSFLWVVVSGAAAWAVLNFSLLIDLQAFLNTQSTLAIMSRRPSSVSGTAAAAWVALTSRAGGVAGVILVLSAVAAVAALISVKQPMVRSRYAMLVAASAAAFLLVISQAGTRETPHLMLPYATMAVLLLVLGVAVLPGAIGRYGAIITTLAFLCFAGVRLADIYRQMLGAPLTEMAMQSVREHVPPGSKIATSMGLPLKLPLSPQSMVETRAHDLALARKYHVTLPEVATPAPPKSAGSYVVRIFPYAMGGMENLPEDTKITVPFTWPLQAREWTLEYWFNEGYNWFLIDPNFRNTGQPAIYKSFFDSVAQACRKVARVDSGRDLLNEQPLELYQCAGAQKAVRPAA